MTTQRKREDFETRLEFNGDAWTMFILYKGQPVYGFGTVSNCYKEKHRSQRDTQLRKEEVEVNINHLISIPSEDQKRRMDAIDASTYTFEIDCYPENDAPIIPTIRVWEQNVDLGKKMVNSQLIYLKEQYKLRGSTVVTVIGPDGEYLDSDEVDFADVKVS